MVPERDIKRFKMLYIIIIKTGGKVDLFWN